MTAVFTYIIKFTPMYVAITYPEATYIMSPVKIPDFGIFIRKQALSNRNIPFSELQEIFERDNPYDEDQDLISFGPCFGGEASAIFVSRLEAHGLVYGIDFYDYLDNMPDWCQIYASVKKNDEE